MKLFTLLKRTCIKVALLLGAAACVSTSAVLSSMVESLLCGGTPSVHIPAQVPVIIIAGMVVGMAGAVFGGYSRNRRIRFIAWGMIWGAAGPLLNAMNVFQPRDLPYLISALVVGAVFALFARFMWRWSGRSVCDSTTTSTAAC